MKIMKKLLSVISDCTEFILELFFPPRCLLCSEIFPKKNLKTELYLCDTCRKEISFLSGYRSLCIKCSRPIDDDNILCPLCQVCGYHFDSALSCCIYEKDVRKALLSYKFGDARYKYRSFAEMMLPVLTESPYYSYADVICSVPVSKSRRKERGFDHMHPISKYISAKTKIPYAKDAIIKVKDVPPQSKLSFSERKSSVKGAFKVARASSIRGKTVILIDDILTTGATVSEISKVLKQAGAERVIVLTICITKIK